MESIFFLLFIMAISSGKTIPLWLAAGTTASASAANDNMGVDQPIISTRTNEDAMTTTANPSNKATKVSPIMKEKSGKKSYVMKQRFRRSFGFKSKCIPEEKKKCWIFHHRGLKKIFCLMYTDTVCLALD